MDLRDADQPLRTGRQLLADRQPRAAGADPAVRRGAAPRARPVVTNWGSGIARAASSCTSTTSPTACLHLLEHYDGPGQVNVGTGQDATIAEIAGLVAEAVGYEGRTMWDTSKPDGTPRKLLDVSRLRDLGWSARTPLRDGIAATVEWYRSHADHLREVG